MRVCGPLATVAVTAQHVFRAFVRASLATTASVRSTSVADPSCYGLTLFRDVLYLDPVYPSCSGGFPLQPPQGAGARGGYTLPEARRPKARSFRHFLGRKTAEKALVMVIQEDWIGDVWTRRVDELVQAMGLSVISKRQG